MNNKLHLGLLCALAALVCSCATTSVEKTWKAPNAQGLSGKIAVLAMDDDGMVRQVFENSFVAQLSTNGVSAMPTFNHFTLAELKQDKNAAAQLLHAKGAETLLIVRLIDKSTSYRESRPGPERYAATITDYDTMGWYDYYNVAFINMSTTYGNLKDRVLIETSLYNLKTEKRQWSATTKTVVSDDTDRLVEVKVIIQKVMEAMHKDGMI